MATIFYECMSGIFSSSCYFVIYGFLVYVTIPLIFKIYPKIVFEGLFLNRVCPPVWLLKLNKPDKAYNLKESKNCYVKSSSGSTLGVWHIPPVTQYDTPEVKSGSLQDAEKIIIYCHGNSFHRGFKHRRDLYSELQKSAPERRCDNRALGSFTRHLHQHEGAIAHVRPERWHLTPRLSDT
ncbi:lysophosphatidylserine lipase ABHD12-like isoform X2 [Styela clava]